MHTGPEMFAEWVVNGISHLSTQVLGYRYQVGEDSIVEKILNGN